MMKLTKTLICLTLVVLVTCRTLEEDEQTIGWGKAEEDEQTIGWGRAEAAEGNMKGGVELELVEEEQHFGLGSGEELF